MGELENAIKILQKRFGKVYISYGNKNVYDEYKRNSFGIFALDLATGGGIPERKIVTLAGKYSSGKSTTSICAIAEIQKKNGKVALVDTEGSFDSIWASKFSVNKNKILYSSPSTIEQVSDTMEPLLMSGELDLIIFDSIAATPTSKELEESSEKKSMGGKATEIGLMMRKLRARLNQNENIKTSILIINQLRDKVNGWGSAEYMPGGTQLHNQSDIIIYMRTSNWVGEIKKPTGISIKFRVVKNKTAPPLQTGEFELLFNGKINNKKSVLEEAIRVGLIKKSGGWYQIGKKKVQGLETLAKKMDIKMYEKLIEKIKEKIKNDS